MACIARDEIFSLKGQRLKWNELQVVESSVVLSFPLLFQQSSGKISKVVWSLAWVWNVDDWISL